MSQGIDRHVHLRPLASLVSVVTGPPTALGSGLKGAAVEDSGRQLRVPADGKTKQGAEIVDDGLETAGRQSAVALLVDHLPGREVLGQVAPRRAGGDHEGPFGIRHIAGVWLVSDHTLNYVGY